MTAGNPIPIERVNGRLPTLRFGLAWDAFNLDPKVAQQKTGLPDEVLEPVRADGDQVNALLRPPEDYADLDAVVFYCRNGVPEDYLSGQKNNTLDGALAHSGDDTTGATGGWDEVAIMQLGLLPPDITALGLLFKAPRRQPLYQVPNIRAGLFYAQSEQPLLLWNRSFAPTDTMMMFALLLRQGEDFVVRPVMRGYPLFDPLSMAPVFGECM